MDKLINLNLTDFITELASSSPAPGGGSIAAFSGAESAALFSMVCHLTKGKKKYADVKAEMEGLIPQLAELQKFFLEAVDRDTNSFNGVMAAFKLPKNTDEEKAHRSQVIQKEYKKAANVPLGVGLKTLDLLEAAEALVHRGNQNSLTDAGVGIIQLRACITGAFYNVKINLGAIKDEAYIEETEKTMAEAMAKVDDVTLPLLQEIKEKLA